MTILKTIASAVGLIVLIELGLVATIVLAWLLKQFWGMRK